MIFFDYQNILLILITLLNISLGIIIFKSPKRVGKLFMVNVFTIVFWSITMIIFRSVGEENIMIWSQILYFSATLIASSFLYFSYIFPENSRLDKNKLFLLLGGNIFIIYLIFFTPLIIESVIIKESSENIINFGKGYWLYAAYIMFYFSYGFWIIFKKYRNLKGITRQQVLLFLFGYFITANISFSTNLISPWLGYYELNWVGQITTIFIISFTAYAIIKYRFMDIRVAIKRSLIFTILVLIITSVFSVSAFLLSNYVQTFFGQNSILISGVITGIMVAFGFEPIKNWLTRATDSILFKGRIDPQLALSQASTQISSVLDIKRLAKVISKTAYDVLKFSKFKVYILSEETDSCRLIYKEGKGGTQDVKRDNPIFQYYETYEKEIKNKQILVIDELRYLSEQTNDDFLKGIVSYLEAHNLSVVVPLYIKDEPLGFLLMGEKKSGDPYSNEDLNFLRVLGGQATIAFENAKLYEEQLQFADKLQDEVEKATKELQAANKELKKLDQAKSEFISIASHQLRTPMTAIKGYMSMVEEGDFGEVPEKIQKPVHNVRESSDRLLYLIEDLLNISRIESGRMQYEFEKANMKKIVKSVYEELRNHAESKGLEFIYHEPKEDIPDVIMDKLKVREVVMNLADNAIKYTDEGKVELVLEKKGNEIRYSVKDTGRGLSKDDKGKLFKKFSRVGSSKLVHTEGTGLGLYIAKQIIKKHKGKLWAESEGVGKGSMFALSLKIKNPALEEKLEKTKALAAQEKQVIQDNPDEPMEDTIDMSRIKIKKKKK